MIKNRHIYLLQWLLCSTFIVLFSACSSGDSEEVAGTTHKQAKLAIYVYAPEQAAAKRNGAPHRANEGEVGAITNEGTIKSLHIWIYEQETGDYVGYFSTEDVSALNQGQGTTYQIPTTRAALLEGAKITGGLSGHFGLEQNTRTVPDDGLPFAGMLTGEPVVGDAPTLRVGTLSAVSTVQLTRAVSKLRFVFAKTTGQPTVNISSIKMNIGMIPDVEYLFKTPESMDYNTVKAELKSKAINDVAETDDPTKYLYLGQEAQAYEDLINEAVSKATPEVTVEGPIYLRESDKQLAGTITYTIGGGNAQTVDFAMQQAGDFKRNHTWIVYAYYAGAGKLQVQSLYVKDWSTKEMNHQVYNW